MIKINEYIPQSELQVEYTQITSPKYPVIDFHSHFGKLLLGEDYHLMYDTGEVVERLKQLGLTHIVNLDGGYGEEFKKIQKKVGEYCDFILNFGTVPVHEFENCSFEKTVYQTIKDLKANGIKGLKFWKVIGLDIQDSKGNYLRPDDKRLQCIWQTASEFDLPVLFHIADPVAFFKPINRYNERYEELHVHPDWSFCKEGLYKFEELMQMSQNLLEANPDTTFVMAHVASFSENLKEVSRWLDKYPNMYIDIAERISELGRQPYSSKAFFEKHSDKIILGTDFVPGKEYDMDIYYRFLETYDEYFKYCKNEIPPQGRWNIYGIGLEDEILKRVYHQNAKKLLKL